MQIKTMLVSCHQAASKPVKQEVNGTVILPPLVFLGLSYQSQLRILSFLSGLWPNLVMIIKDDSRVVNKLET